MRPAKKKLTRHGRKNQNEELMSLNPEKFRQFQVSRFFDRLESDSRLDQSTRITAYCMSTKVKQKYKVAGVLVAYALIDGVRDRVAGVSKKQTPR